jgi:hypothetical protein
MKRMSLTKAKDFDRKFDKGEDVIHSQDIILAEEIAYAGKGLSPHLRRALVRVNTYFYVAKTSNSTY